MKTLCHRTVVLLLAGLLVGLCGCNPDGDDPAEDGDVSEELESELSAEVEAVERPEGVRWVDNEAAAFGVGDNDAEGVFGKIMAVLLFALLKRRATAAT